MNNLAPMKIVLGVQGKLNLMPRYYGIERLGKSPLDGSSLFLQVTRPSIKAWMSLNLGKILPLTSELAAFEFLKNQCIVL